MKLKAIHVAITVLILGPYVMAQQASAPGQNPASNTAEAHNHDHNQTQPQPATHNHEESGAPVSYAELKKTVSDLARVKAVTAKFRDAKVAQAAGYQPRGDEIKGMGIHFVREMEPDAVHLEKPPMLVYETDPSVPGGYKLVGVVYLLKGEEGPDGQPANNPFPKPLAVWHKHENICMLSKTEHVTKLSLEECQRRGGHYNTEWMLHAWIWKDSPRGVFSDRNPLVGKAGGDREVHLK